MSVKYILHPGWVTSKHDGDRHYITSPDLIRLYGVHAAECLVHYKGYRTVLPKGVTEEDLIQLYPDPSGKYEIPNDK